MIKEYKYCDRCGREIKEEKNPKSIFETLTKALGRLFEDDPTGYVICRARLATEKEYTPLMLCKDCNDHLQRFMQKTEIHGCITDPDAEIKEREKVTDNALKEQRQHGEWIPCSERLPEEHGYYLVTTDGSRNAVIDIAEYGKFFRKPEYECVWEWNKASKILAWMPLPEPHKEEGEAE